MNNGVEQRRDRPMWDESECADERTSAADVRSSWVIVVAILFGKAAGLTFGWS
jgi:hypothetical protein